MGTLETLVPIAAGGGKGPYKYLVETDGTNITVYDKDGNKAYGPVTDAATAINWALSNLTSGRTWKEKAVIKGNYIINTTIKVPSYTILEIQGKLSLADNANCDVIQNSDQTNGNTQIEIIGGIIDANKNGQTNANNCIRLTKCTYSIVKKVHVKNAKRPSGETLYGEGIYFDGCTYCIATDNIAENCDKNGLKARDVSAAISQIVFANNICINNLDGGIQIAGDQGNGAEYCTVSNNVIIMPSTLGPNNVTTGIKFHDAKKISCTGNIIKGPGNTLTSRYGIELVANCFLSVIAANYIDNIYYGIFSHTTYGTISLIANVITGATTGIYILTGNENNVQANYLNSCTTGINIAANDSLITQNRLRNVTTPITNTGTGNIINENVGNVGFYQTTTDTWAAYTGPTGTPTNGTRVIVYSSGEPGYRLYCYVNGGWRYVDLT